MQWHDGTVQQRKHSSGSERRVNTSTHTYCRLRFAADVTRFVGACVDECALGTRPTLRGSRGLSLRFLGKRVEWRVNTAGERLNPVSE